jgi:predicted alpha/beta-hydrolase family hydrolase
MTDFIFDGPKTAQVTVLLAHGAGAPMDNTWMTTMAEGLAAAGLRVARCEFGYMAGRRNGERKPPPRGESLMGEYRDAVAALKAKTPLVIGGKSLGGRVASMVAQELGDAGSVAGLVCLGYPFHPPGQAEKLRTAHLEKLTVKTLICQGTRDPFGTEDEVAAYKLSKAIKVHWLPDGDHDFRARVKISGRGLKENMAEAVETVAAFCGKVG